MPSARYTIQTACECQAILGATLNEKRLVIEGWARWGAHTQRAPAHSLGPAAERFDVTWQCPYCGRNPQRMFYAGALRRASDAT